MGLFGKKKEVKTAETAAAANAEAQEAKTENTERPASGPQGHLTVRIFCSAGASTSLFASTVQKVMDAKGFDGEIKAYSASTINENGVSADVILIGPQSRFLEPNVKKMFPDKKVAVVPPQIFGAMNGEKGLEYILSLIG